MAEYIERMLSPGESLDGYRIIRLIGSGGFGQVWLCQSEALSDFRALKFIPAADPTRLNKEFDALVSYRTAAGQLRSPSIMPIEHVNRISDGLFYIMPLADGYGAADPQSSDWRPWTLAGIIEGSRGNPTWLTSGEIKGYFTPILHALQLLSDAKLVHRDVKPENILFLGGTPCLGDISLLKEDSHNLSRPGTPGYSAPSWYVESGGHPDMYGAATTLYTLLTGNHPDKIARNAFRWPPQGEESLPEVGRREWLRLHQVIRRAVDERPAERFADFTSFARALEVGDDDQPGKRPQKTPLFAGLVVAAIICLAGLSLWLGHSFRQHTGTSVTNPPTPVQSGSVGNTPSGTTVAPEVATNGAEITKQENVPEVYRAQVQSFENALEKIRKNLVLPINHFSDDVDAIYARLNDFSRHKDLSPEEASTQIAEIAKRFQAVLAFAPKKPTAEVKAEGIEELRSLLAQIQQTPAIPSDGEQFGRKVRPKLQAELENLAQELNSDEDSSIEQIKRVMSAAMGIRNRWTVESVNSAILHDVDAALHNQKNSPEDLEKTKKQESLKQSVVNSATEVYLAAQQHLPPTGLQPSTLALPQ
ncbi:MAG: hypothetical protein D4R65_09100 [Verrucomicrobiaceae bacterium]|nr:MAG: hypothetical protein D4R65_09100 [Verrucomicrobiaceae bacterium]